jgi:hypothetical protein
MNLGSIGKVLANQAMETTKKSVIDAVTGPETKARPVDTTTAPKPAAGLDIGAIILGQIQAMQRPLREDQELQVSLGAAHDVLLVSEVFVPHSAVLVFSGLDNEGRVTRVIMPADRVQLMCKIMAVAPGATARRVTIIPPKPRPEVAATSPAAAAAQHS